MSAWNLSAENIQVATEIVIVTAVNTDAVPRCLQRLEKASLRLEPVVLHLVLHALEEVDAVVDADADAERDHRQRVDLDADAEHRHQRVAQHRHEREREHDAERDRQRAER